MEKVRIGIIGLGRVFRLGYLPWLRGYLRVHPYCELTALSDTREEMGRRYAERFHCRHFPDAGDLMDSGRVDAVIINTPNWVHEEQVLRAARAGLHVLCEKPMAPTSEACDRMVEACGSRGLRLQMSFMRRFDPGFQRIRRMVQEGALGEVVELRAEWPYFIPDLDASPYREALGFIHSRFGVNLPEKYGAWRLKDPRCGGGDFLDHGPHLLDFFRFAAGDITHIGGASRPLVEGRNEDWATCMVRFRSGAAGHITTTLHDFRHGLVGRIHGLVRGTRGILGFTMPNVDKFRHMRHLRWYREPESDMGKILRAFGLLKSRRVPLSRANVFQAQLDHFATALLGTRPPHPLFGDEDFAATGEDGRATIRMVELLYRSTRTGETYRV